MEYKQNILIVHNYYQISGGEDTVVANEMKMLQEHGHQVTLYSRSNNELKTMGKAKKLLLPFSMIFNLRTYKEVKKIIKEKNIEIVHVHNTLNLISPAVYYASLYAKVPVIQTVHNFRLLCPGATFYRNGHICEDCVTKGLGCAVKHNCYRNNKFQTLACVINTKIHRMTGIYGKINYICLTEFNKEKLLSLRQIEQKRVFIKPNFAKVNVANKKDCNRKRQILYLGRIEEIKGIKLLIETWKKYGSTLPLLKMCGNGPLKEWCYSEIESNKIQNVVLCDFMSHENAMKELAASLALILPTRVYEGFPMTIVEALACATPVICSNFGNAGSLIDDGITGYKFEGTPEDICNAITKTLNDSSINEKCINKFNREYTEAENYSRLLEIYNVLDR